MIKIAKTILPYAFTLSQSLEDLLRYFFPSIPFIKKLSEAKLYITIQASKNNGKSIAGLLKATPNRNKTVMPNNTATGNNKKLNMR